MENNSPPAERRFKDLTGNISVNFKDNVDFGHLIAEESGFSWDRFEPIAIRFYMESVVQVTVYAIDKDRLASWDKAEKLPVHKFKMNEDLLQLLPMIKDVNFTLSTGAYDLEKMEIINK